MKELGRTYRVPRRVMDQVREGIRKYMMFGVVPGDEEALRIARALVSDEPVGLDIPATVGAFFTRDWAFRPEKIRLCDLYGGEVGREWALKCVVASGLVAAADLPNDHDPLPLRGWMDDPQNVFDAIIPTAEEMEALINYDPLIEDLLSVEDEPLPAGAEEVQGTLTPSGGSDGSGGGGVPAAGGAPIPAAGTDPGSYTAIFPDPGARVRSSTGDLGWMKETDEQGFAVVSLDDGSEAALDPADVQVVTASGRARLRPAPELVAEPFRRLDAYQEWAAERLAGGAS